MKRALLVGIDAYQNFNSLGGCVNDVEALHPLLARHEDASVNMHCRVMTARDASEAVGRDEFLEALDGLFAPGADFTLLYFSGHGAQVADDVALATSDGTSNTPGVRFEEILAMVAASKARECLIILDCCFAGGGGSLALQMKGTASLPEGLSILAASRSDQVSMETWDGRGQFSTYVEGALDGGAADVLGRVSVAGLYAYVSESFDAWEQRPTFKANIDRLHDIRLCSPRVPLETLRRLGEWFPSVDSVMDLDPSFEPTEEPRHAENEAIFSALQKLRAAKLVDPVGEEHLYFAAMNSTGCDLTPLGKHYWSMAKAGLI